MRFPGFHFADDHEEQRLANVAEEILDRIKHGWLALQIGCQLQERGKRRFRPVTKLQIMIGNHAELLIR